MSERNVELARQIMEALNKAEFERAFALANTPPEFEFVPSGSLIPDLATVQRGREAFRRVVETFFAEFDNAHIEVQELVDAGDRVFISATVRGRGKQSGAETTWDVWSVWTVRDDRLVRWQGFTDRGAARAAAELLQ